MRCLMWELLLKIVIHYCPRLNFEPVSAKTKLKKYCMQFSIQTSLYSEICQYLEGYFQSISYLKTFIAVVKEIRKVIFQECKTCFLFFGNGMESNICVRLCITQKRLKASLSSIQRYIKSIWQGRFCCLTRTRYFQYCSPLHESGTTNSQEV